MEYIYHAYVAAAGICLGGILYRTVGIFGLGSGQAEFSFMARLGGALSGAGAALGSPGRLLSAVRTLVLDILFQAPVLVRSPLAWLMHMLIFLGFAGLFIFHAFEPLTSEAFFDGYASTLAPYLFLRNLMGSLVLSGLALAVYRRRTMIRLRQVSKTGDYAAIAILAMIIGSGFLLEAGKIVSWPVFDEMMEEWGVMVDQEEVLPLETYWQERFNVHFEDGPIRVTPERMALGQEVHENNCAECHASPRWAFVSYPLSKAMGPVAGVLNTYRFDSLFLIFHIFCCIAGLVILPFSKFSHILASPVSLMVRGVTSQRVERPENRETRRALDLSACTRCGACTTHCAVAPVFDLVNNPWVLPLERLDQVRRSERGAPLAPEEFRAFWEASFLCTGCNTCAMVCPAGLDLQDIWTRVRHDLTRSAFPDPVILGRQSNLARRAESPMAGDVIRISPDAVRSGEGMIESLDGYDASGCYTCLTCSNSCPVAGALDPAFGTAPHQVVHLVSLGLRDLALGAPLVWDCLTCYQCQENCPQGVKITDLFFDLRRTALSRPGSP